MKKLILATVVVLTASKTFAQQTHARHHNPMAKDSATMHKVANAEERAHQQADRLEKMLALTPDQKTKVYNAALTKNNTIQQHAAQYKKDTNKVAFQDKVKNTRQSFVNEVNTILTPEQQTKWSALKEKKVKEKHGVKPKQQDIELNEDEE